MSRPDSTSDERFFAVTLGVTASLSLILHTLALTVGISLASGIIGIALWDLLLLAVASRFPAPRQLGFTMPELIAVVAIAGFAVVWMVNAANSIDVEGPDAAHYHVPYALNMAHGASPFDLLATPHLYPMAASVVTAWFIVPMGTPLLVDLATVLPFLVLVASINLIFRRATGLSGLAWATWVGLALYLTPLFHGVSQGSADLWFTAACVALVAACIDAWIRSAWSPLTMALVGGAIGLLVGSKSTGAPALFLIAVAVALIALVMRRRASTARGSVPWLALAMGGAMALGAGGVWLIRNWIQYGSPLAPAGLSIAGVTIFPGESFQQSRHFSVLAEMEGSSFNVWSSARDYINQWLGPWFVPALALVALFAGDLLLRFIRRDTSDRVRARTMLVACMLSLGGGLIFLLIGAPWTGLDHSRGLALRYILPVFAIIVATALVGAFPLSLPWFERRWPVARVVFLPRPVAFIVSGALLLSIVPFLAGRHTSARLLYELKYFAQLNREPSGARNNNHAALPALLDGERAMQLRCPSRRIYLLMRFDEPLSLQPADFTSEVYYAGRDPGVNRREGPLQPCDYVITSPAVAETNKGGELADALAGGQKLLTIGATRDFIIMTVGGAGR